MREFEQMEMQFFGKPGTQKEWYEQWKKKQNGMAFINWNK
jgi:glycyl-tRNA synthetase